MKPRLRGALHLGAFPVAVLAGAVLVAVGTRARVPLAVYAVSISGLFGASALYHRGDWSPQVRLRLRRLDHSMIFLAIAGTYTAVATLSLAASVSVPLLTVVWATAVVGIGVRFAKIRAPKRLAVIPYLAVGWVAVAALPPLLHSLGVLGLGLIVAGGAFYTTGAIVFARQRPDPVPAVFGYHEVFHAFVIAGALAHFLAIAFVALPAA